MTMDEMRELWEKHDDEFLKFENVKEPRHRRPDLCAFLLLDVLEPGRVPHGRDGAFDMISGARHDEIFLDTDAEKLAAVITEADVLTLVRCGVRLDEEGEGLAMFV